MKWELIESKWQQLTGSVKENWGKLTDDDLTQISGKREQLSGKIQEVYGITKRKPRSRYGTGERQLRMCAEQLPEGSSGHL